jgi:predicted lipoprotein
MTNNAMTNNLALPNKPRVSPVISPPAVRRSVWPMLTLLAANALAGVGVWYAMEQPINTAPITGAAGSVPGDRVTTIDPGSLLPRVRSTADLPETAKRPLFAANRRPWVEKPKPEIEPVKVSAPAAAVVPPYPANQLQLVGVMEASRTRAARGLIRAGSDPQGTWVQVGESIRGWKLREVTSDSAIIETRGERASLSMDWSATTGQPQQLQQPQQPFAQPKR